MDVSLTLFGQIFSVSILATAVCTYWYARTASPHTTAGVVLLVFAWIVPVIGPICLLVFLAGLPKRVAEES